MDGVGGTSGESGSGGSSDFVNPCPFGGGGTCGCVACGPGGACKDCGGGCDCTNTGGMPVNPTQPTPTPLPWVPPFESVGADGWRDSTVPLCSQIVAPLSLDVWSDERGVFVLTSGIGVNPMGDVDGTFPTPDDDAGLPPPPLAGGAFGMDPGAALPRTQLWLNDGTGWSIQLDRSFQFGSFGLEGAKDGPLFMYEQPLSPMLQAEIDQMGPQPIATRCSLGVFDGKKLQCQDLGQVNGLHVANPQLTYAVIGDTRLLTYDGASWRAVPSLIPYPATAVWGDGSKVLVVGKVGTAFWQNQDSWTLQDAGIVDHFSELWGAAADDIWAGTAHGDILHYDGMKWTQVGSLGGVTCDVQLPITGIWGSGDQVYFHTDTQLARWNGSKLETLANWSCTGGNQSTVKIGGVWGNGPDEIFLTIMDGVRFDPGGCGATYVVFYDGTDFHRM